MKAWTRYLQESSGQIPSGCQELTLFPGRLLSLLSIPIPEGSCRGDLTDIIWPYKMYLWAFVSI